MKKTAIIAGAVFLLFAATASAQTDTTLPAQPVKTKTDQWNNNPPEKYKLQPMPDALTTEKIFPVIGKYSLTDKEGAASNVSIMLDETNKGVVWIEGLPQGRIKAYLRQSPGIYRIPVQKTADEKDLAEGVLIFNKDANTLDVCIGCPYNNEDPAIAFAPVTEPEPVVVETKTKKGTKKSVVKTKVKPLKTWKYSGNKLEEGSASVSPVQQ
jgi:hypothetical protein